MLLGKINELGCDLPLEVWLDSSFILPFKISPELADYGPDMSERILQRSIVPHGSKYSLFMQFKRPTSKVIRVTVIYKQARILAIDRRVFFGDKIFLKKFKKKFLEKKFFQCLIRAPHCFFSDTDTHSKILISTSGRLVGLSVHKKKNFLKKKNFFHKKHFSYADVRECLLDYGRRYSKTTNYMQYLLFHH